MTHSTRFPEHFLSKLRYGENRIGLLFGYLNYGFFLNKHTNNQSNIFFSSAVIT